MDKGYWILDTEYRILDIGYLIRIVDTGYCTLDTRYRILNTGY